MSTATFDPRDRIDLRYPDRSRVRLLARSGGYVMVRKPHAHPFVLTEKEWARMPLWDGGEKQPSTANPEEASVMNHD